MLNQTWSRRMDVLRALQNSKWEKSSVLATVKALLYVLQRGNFITDVRIWYFSSDGRDLKILLSSTIWPRLLRAKHQWQKESYFQTCLRLWELEKEQHLARASKSSRIRWNTYVHKQISPGQAYYVAGSSRVGFCLTWAEDNVRKDQQTALHDIFGARPENRDTWPHNYELHRTDLPAAPLRLVQNILKPPSAHWVTPRYG